jgi:hypothetical protein
MRRFNKYKERRRRKRTRNRKIRELLLNQCRIQQRWKLRRRISRKWLWTVVMRSLRSN